MYDFRVNLEQKLSNLTSHNDTLDDIVAETVRTRDNKLQIYTIMTLLSTFVTVVSIIVYCKIFIKASLNLHKHMITNVLNATMHFFDSTFIGNILNRFSLDFNVIDDYLPFMINQVFRVRKDIPKEKILMFIILDDFRTNCNYDINSHSEHFFFTSVGAIFWTAVFIKKILFKNIAKSEKT